MLDYRLLRADETDAAAMLHREVGVLIPGYDMSIHTPDEHRAFYRNEVFPAGSIWAAFDGDLLVGFIALKPGWIDHLYVLPARHGKGIGRALIAIAQREQDDLQLHTFQSNARARRIYERAGFAAEEFGDGSGNEEGMPDVRYRWQRPLFD